MEMFAKRAGVSDFLLYVRDAGGLAIRIGRLADCEVCHVFTDADEELADLVNDKMEGDMSPRERFAVVREVYTAWTAGHAAEHAAELATERAMWNALETNDEHRAEMEWQDAMGYT